MKALLELYGNGYCHLCDDMQRALVPWQQRFGFELRVIDITDNEELEHRFGERIPVLLHEGEEICHYFLDEAALESRLAD